MLPILQLKAFVFFSWGINKQDFLKIRHQNDIASYAKEIAKSKELFHFFDVAQCGLWLHSNHTWQLLVFSPCSYPGMISMMGVGLP